MITSSNIVEFFELYLRPFLEQESRLTKELAADEAIAVYGQARGGAAASGDDDALDRTTCSRKHWNKD